MIQSIFSYNGTDTSTEYSEFDTDELLLHSISTQYVPKYKILLKRQWKPSKVKKLLTCNYKRIKITCRNNLP